MVKPVGSSQCSVRNGSRLVGPTPGQEGQKEILVLLLRETYSWVGRAEPDCLEGGTHEETLRPQVHISESRVSEALRNRGLKPIA